MELLIKYRTPRLINDKDPRHKMGVYMYVSLVATVAPPSDGT